MIAGRFCHAHATYNIHSSIPSTQKVNLFPVQKRPIFQRLGASFIYLPLSDLPSFYRFQSNYRYILKARKRRIIWNLFFITRRVTRFLFHASIFGNPDPRLLAILTRPSLCVTRLLCAGCAAPPAPGPAPRPAAGRCRAARPRWRTRAPWSRCSTPRPPGAPSPPTPACRASGTQVISSHLISSEKVFSIIYNLLQFAITKCCY